MAFDSIPLRVQEQAKRRPAAPAYCVRSGGNWQPTSWGEYADDVRRAGKALIGLGLQPGDTACIVVRPEAIQFSAKPANGVNAMPGKIRQRVFKGNHTSMLVEVADGTRLNALLHLGDAEAVNGEDVWISWKPQNATVIRDEAVPA